MQRFLVATPMVAAALVVLVGCGPKDDMPVPDLTKVSTPPKVDVSAFEGTIKVTGMEILKGGHNVTVRGEATEDIGDSPYPVTVDLVDEAGAPLGSTPAMLVLDEEIERGPDGVPRPPAGPQAISAGSKVFITVSVARASKAPAKLVIAPGGMAAGPRGPMP